MMEMDAKLRRELDELLEELGVEPPRTVRVQKIANLRPADFLNELTKARRISPGAVAQLMDGSMWQWTARRL